MDVYLFLETLYLFMSQRLCFADSLKSAKTLKPKHPERPWQLVCVSEDI